jgi:hypothetical protein
MERLYPQPKRLDNMCFNAGHDTTTSIHKSTLSKKIRMKLNSRINSLNRTDLFFHPFAFITTDLGYISRKFKFVNG